MFTVVFFATASGNEPARDFLKTLDRADRLVAGTDLATVQYGFPIGMPVCRPLGDGLYEVCSSLPSRPETRLLFFQDGSDLVVVSGFIKKTRATPVTELQDGARAQADLHGGERSMTMQNGGNPHRGSSLDDLLHADGLHAEATTAALKRVIAWQIREAMRDQKLSKVAMAARMGAPRSQLDRVLNPEDGNVTIDTLQRAARAVGRSVRFELV